MLTDMMMPVMDGGRLTSALRRLAPDLPIVGVSGLAHDARAARAIAAGAGQFLQKPYSADVLLRAVRAALGPPRDFGALKRSLSRQQRYPDCRPQLRAPPVSLMRRLLVLDDDMDVARIIARVAQGSGFETRSPPGPSSFSRRSRTGRRPTSPSTS